MACSRAVAATRCESGCSRWSTISAVVGFSRGGDGRQRQRVRPARQRDAPRSSRRRSGRRERRHRGPQRGYSTRSIHRCGSSISVGQRQCFGARPDGVEPGHPDPLHDVVDERLAAGVLAHLGVDAEQRAQHALQRRLLALAPLVEPPSDGGHRRHDGGPDGVHHVVGVALQQRAEHQQLVQRVLLRLGLHGPQHAEHAGRIRFGRNTVAAIADEVGQPADHLGDVLAGLLGQHRRARCDMWSASHGLARNCTRWVTSCRHTHSRKSAGDTRSCRSTAITLGYTSKQLAAVRRRTGRTGRGCPRR